MSPVALRLTYATLGLATGVALTLWLAPLPAVVLVAICPAPVLT